MSSRRYWLISLCLLSLATFAKQPLTTDAPLVTALSHADIYLSATEKRTNATLLIAGNKIIDIVANEAIPPSAQIINMQGYSLLPGFIDPFSEYGIEFNYQYPETSPPVYSINTLGGQAPNSAVHAQEQWLHHFAPNVDNAKKWQQNGFTSVQIAKQDGIFQGQAVAVSLAPLATIKTILKPYSNSLISFNKGSSPMAYPESLMGTMALIRQNLTYGQWLKDNVNKLKFNQSPENTTVNSAWQAIANQWSNTWIVNAGDLNNVLRAGRLLAEPKLTTVLVASGREYARIDEIKALKASFIVPLNFPQAPNVQDSNIALDTSLEQLRHWHSAPSNPSFLAKANIPFAFTQHAIDAKDFWPRVQLAVKSGLAAQDALAALTSTPAAMIGIDDNVGKLAPGFMADIVVAKGDIFIDGEIVGVYLQGQPNFNQVTLAQRKLAGDYQLQFADISLELTLNPTQLSSSYLQAGEETIDLLAPTLNQNHLSFAAAIEQNHKMYRFSLWFDDSGVHGRVLLPDGSPEPVAGVAELDSQTNSAALDASSHDHAAQVFGAPKLTSPNGAYGREAVPQFEKLHILGASVWTSAKEGVLTNTDVLISDGKITAIGQQLATPSGFKRLDASGMHLSAGIIDEHSHIALNGGTNEGTDAVTAEVRIADVLNPDSINIYQSLAGGVTSSQILHGSANPIGGQAQLIKLRWGQSAEGLKFTEAPAAIKLALGENVKQSHWGDEFVTRFPQTRMGVKSVMVDAFKAAKQYQAKHQAWNALRASEQKQVPAPAIDYRLQAIAEIINGKRQVHVHAYVQSEILMFLRLSQSYGFSISAFTHVLEGYKVADELAAAGAGASTFSDWWAYKFEVFDAIPQNACMLNNKGVVTSLNSDDYSMQRRLNQEAAKSIMYCGMTEMEAWNMVTINPAKQLGVDKLVGSIEVGKHADLVLWNNNPLSVYAKTQAVWIDGRRYFDRQEHQQLEQAMIIEKEQLIQQVLNADDKRKDGEPEVDIAEPDWQCDSHYQFNHAQNLFNGGHH